MQPDEYIQKLNEAIYLEGMVVKAGARRPWEPPLKTPGTIGEMKARINTLREEINPMSYKLTKEARPETLMIAKGKTSAIDKSQYGRNLQKLIAEGRFWKKD